MNGARPELIFVAGPQAGQRAVLMTSTVLVGRSSSADVRLVEQAASREQMTFQWTEEGWLFQNLSANGTVVNGRRYKRKKQLILETGDVIGVGAETLILYVSPGDDPEEALAEYRRTHPAEPAPAAPAGAEAPPKRPEDDTSRPKPPRGGEADAGDGQQAPQEAPGPAPGGEEARPTGKLKYILFAIVMVSMVLFGVAIIKRATESDDDYSGPGGPPRLTDSQISEALAAPLELETLSPVKAAAALDRAVRSYTNRQLWEPGDLFRCVRDFKLHLANRGTQTFDRVEHETMAARAARELDELVREKYNNAWKWEKAQSYRNAYAAFEELLQILPVEEIGRDDRIRQVIIPNVIAHMKFVKSRIGKVRSW